MNDAAPPPIVFAELIERLRREGFAIGTSHYLRLQQFLPHVAELPPERMRTVLCPLFARNAEEQARFYRAWDDFLAHRLPVAAGDVAAVARESAPSASPRKRGRRWIWFAAALLALALLAMVAKIAEPPPPPDGDGGAADRGTVPIVVPSQSGSSRPALSMRTAVERTRALAAEHPILLGTALVLLVALIGELGRSLSRIVRRHRHEGSGHPFAWPLRADDAAAAGLFISRAFDDATRLLRGRESSGQQRLDIPRTVRESLRALGHIVPVYRAGQRPPEYLLLIERRGARDHLAAYFDALAEALARGSVLVERAYFASDPRSAAAELRHRHPDHRLLLCVGSPSALLDPVTGEPAPWVDGAFPWQQRGLLAAEDVASAAALRRLRFAIGEATADGLRGVAESWQVPNEGRRIDAALPALAPDPSLDTVREALSPAAEVLLLRCAAHTSLDWALTCALLPHGIEAAEAERVLLEVSRLAWFRHGSIPARDRERLVEELERRDDAVAVREIVLRVLGESTPPAGSAAARAREVAAVSQRMFIDHTSRAAFRRAARTLRRYPPAMLRADLPLVSLLRQAPTTRVWRRVHGAVRRVFFPFASPALGFRPFAGLVPIAAAAAVLFFAGALTARSPQNPAFSGRGGGGGVSGDLPAEQRPVQTATSVTRTTSTGSVAEAPAVTTTTVADVVPDTAPRIFRPEDLPIPEVVPPPATESSPPATALPEPLLQRPAGRVEVSWSGDPIDFIWSRYGAYELVVWKGSPAGEPLHTQRVTGVRYTWRPGELDLSATYYWTLRAPDVPPTLEPASFVLTVVALDNLRARDAADQLRRSREAYEEFIVELPCNESKSLFPTTDSETVRFSVGPNEEIVNARAEVVFHFLVERGQVGTSVSGDTVTVTYALRSTSYTCEVLGRARVRVTATIGPRIR